MQPQYKPSEKDLQRLWSRIDKSGGPDTCWPWVGKGTPGFHHLLWNGRGRPPHSVVWELANGPVPDGKFFRHCCGNLLCCNPAHLVFADSMEIFWAKIDKSDGTDACWLWKGKHSPSGYSVIRWDSHMQHVHRVTWLLTYGPIPKGIDLGHHCHNPSCVNPSHLYIIDNAARFWQKVDRSGGPDACWEWTGARFYAQYGCFIVADGKNIVAHRFSWQLIYGLIPDGLFVCHHCDNPPCVNPAHLFLGTQADNVRDCHAKGRENHPRGEEHANHKLSDLQIAEIRERYAQGGISQTDLARQFGIVPSHVCKIVNYQRRT